MTDPASAFAVRHERSSLPHVAELVRAIRSGTVALQHLAETMCRIDPATHSAAIKRKGCQTVIMKGRAYQGYVHVDASALKTERALLYWLGQALEFNRTLPQAAK